MATIQKFVPKQQQFTLNDIGYGNPCWEHFQIINKDSFLDKLFSENALIYFPPNDSSITRTELNQIVENIQKLKDNDAQVLADYKAYDNSVPQMLLTFLRNWNQDAVEAQQLVYDLYKDLSPCALKMKYFFNRPRPSQLANYMKLKLFPFRSASANSPSYPSATAFYGYVICNVLGNYYPNLSDLLSTLPQDIAQSRISLGLNYMSDIAAAQLAAERVLSYKDFKTKYKL